MQHKKEREYKVFLDALAKSRKRGGEARRNVDRINGEILDRGGKSESPDFFSWGSAQDQESAPSTNRSRALSR